MSVFENVSVVREANVYFDGQVTNRSVILQDGSRKTLGIMLPGEYEFNTGDKELIEILSGKLRVLLPGNDWVNVNGGESFEVSANSTFLLKIMEITDYVCSFIK
ncbi:MAG: pyrimidine/purine nucleoside phosphorylase [Gammaproteobacteria bacterium]|nr:pyrimidine/purine nucleoside phosphorylase [Gammaproteobacteria bacterium]